MRTSPTDRHGFTLVELAVVVLVVAVLSGLVFVRLDVLIPGERLRGAAAEIVAAARLARAAARTRRVEVILEYDLDSAAWSVYGFFPPIMQDDEESDEEETAACEFRAEEPEVIMSRKLPEGVRLSEVYYGENGVASSGKVEASFTPSGSVGEHMVVLVSDSGTASVFVPALTGDAFVTEKGASYAEIRSRRRRR